MSTLTGRQDVLNIIIAQSELDKPIEVRGQHGFVLLLVVKFTPVVRTTKWNVWWFYYRALNKQCLCFRCFFLFLLRFPVFMCVWVLFFKQKNVHSTKFVLYYLDNVFPLFKKLDEDENTKLEMLKYFAEMSHFLPANAIPDHETRLTTLFNLLNVLLSDLQTTKPFSFKLDFFWRTICRDQAKQTIRIMTQNSTFHLSNAYCFHFMHSPNSIRLSWQVKQTKNDSKSSNWGERAKSSRHESPSVQK